MSVSLPSDAQLAGERESVLGALEGYLERLKAGELGSLPVIVGLAIITLFFTFKVPDRIFFTATNFNTLIGQMAGTVLIAIGVVFVLLLGEIDLSLGFLSGLGGVAIAYFQYPDQVYTVPGIVAILIGLVLCTAVGALQGSFVALVGVPSFVVTLAGNLALQGVIFRWMGSRADIGVQDTTINDVANYYLPHFWGWIAAVGLSAVLLLAMLAGLLSRRRAGLPLGNLTLLLLRWGFVTAVALAAVAICNHAYAPTGVPLAGLIVVAMIGFWTWVATRTTFGRHVYAVGGNPEAARRAGINVAFVRLAVFMIAGLMAAVGGLMELSRQNRVDLTVGGGSLLFDAIAAAVIGGTSLFGGRGRVVAALLGALVIKSINNGMYLLGSDPWKQYVLTGAILLGAVTLDTLARRRQQKAGR